MGDEHSAWPNEGLWWYVLNLQYVLKKRKERMFPQLLRTCSHCPFTEDTDEHKEEGTHQTDGELQASKRCDSGRGKNKT